MNHGERPVALLVELYGEKVRSGASGEALASVMERIQHQVAVENEQYAEESRRMTEMLKEKR